MQITTKRRWRAGLIVLASAMLACSGDDDGSTGPTGSIQLSVSPTSLTIPQGGSGSVTLTLVRGGGFSGTVTATVTGLPAGVTPSVSPSTLSGTTTSATITVDVAASVAAGTYTATVTGAASGVGSATTTFAVTVTAVTPNVALSVTPAALTLARGTSGNTTVNITRTNFTGAVNLSLDAPPAGITGAFNPASATTNSSVLTVTVDVSVTPGNYTVTIKGTATGVGDRTTTLALTVTPPPGSIAIAVSPPAASVAQGSAGQATVTITRTNFTGAVTLAASGAPAGVTIGFSESPTTAAQVQLTYAATLAAAVGTYPITVTASAPGVTNATANFSLQVTQAPPAGQVDFQFCSSSENPVFFAYQDGTGAWQPVTGTQTAGVYHYTFSLTQNRGGVFFVQQSGSASRVIGAAAALPRGAGLVRALPDATARLGITTPAAAVLIDYETTVLYGMTSELAEIGLENCLDSQSTKSVSLAVTGVGAGQTATLSLGGSTEFFIGGLTPPSVQFTDVRSGTIDFFGARESATTGVPNKLLDVRNLNPADGSVLPFVADFNSANAYDPASALLTVSNALGDDLITLASFYTANGDGGLLGGSFAPSTAITRTWYGIPTTKLQAGDVHANIVFASPASTSTDEIRLHFLFSTTVQDLAPVLGPRLVTPTVTSVGVPAYRRLRVQGTLPTEYNDLVIAYFEPSGGGNEITVAQTGAYIAASGNIATYDLSIPDLTTLAGFPLVSGLPGGEIEATVEANGWTGGGTTGALPVNGTVLQGAAKTVKINVP